MKLQQLFEVNAALGDEAEGIKQMVGAKATNPKALALELNNGLKKVFGFQLDDLEKNLLDGNVSDYGFVKQVSAKAAATIGKKAKVSSSVWNDGGFTDKQLAVLKAEFEKLNWKMEEESNYTWFSSKFLGVAIQVAIKHNRGAEVIFN